MKTNIILYVADQKASAIFYEKVLMIQPELNVPGMTEFRLNEETVLGLMPSAGIKRLLGDKLPDPDKAAGIPRAEIYLHVTDPESYHKRALENGAEELSPLSPRDWGDEVAYSLDPDGHVIVFAKKNIK
ncbi:MAG TPA: VOC family protein [Clostridiales bacterium]|nr:VOC family protein [Clostridiales bacterium]